MEPHPDYNVQLRQLPTIPDKKKEAYGLSKTARALAMGVFSRNWNHKVMKAHAISFDRNSSETQS